MLKAKHDMDIVEAKLRRTPLLGASPALSTAASGVSTPKTPFTNDEPLSSDPIDTDEDDEGDMFGNMLDEPDIVVNAPASNTTLKVRSMPIPKQFSFTGNTPKALLRSAVGKLQKPPAVSYVKLSASTRFSRAGLEIRWSSERRRVWKMEDLACDDPEEAENYVSTLALHALATSGDIHCNWRALPPAYRALWEELETIRTGEELKAKRKMWQKIKELAQQKRDVEERLTERDTLRTTGAATTCIKPEADRPARERSSDEIQRTYRQRVQSPAYQKMRRIRDTLPIAPFRNDILDALDSSQVLVLSGETGCGKSTQLPAFILENEQSQGRSCKIIVTEPRRISAISLAQRVSLELGDGPGSMGTKSSLVGYSIRLESKVSSSTRLTYMTNGIALRMLESGSGGGSNKTAFDDVTHIVVDEVHERSIESDFLLIVLKELLQVRKNLKVVLMSATVDADKISSYFNNCPSMCVPGRTYPVNVNFLEDAVELCGWHIDESSPYAVWDRNRKSTVKQLQWTDSTADVEEGNLSGYEDSAQADPTKLQAALYSARTVSTVNLLDSRKIPYDLIIRLLEAVCFGDNDLNEYSAATLVFMPGLAEIRKLNDLLQSHPRFGASGDFVIYPLHSTISSDGQSAVFDVPRKGIRKIVICEFTKFLPVSDEIQRRTSQKQVSPSRISHASLTLGSREK